MSNLPRRDVPRLLTELWEQRESHPQVASFTSIGELSIHSGALSATDPLTAPDRPAFTRSVPSGRHLVLIAEHTDRVAGAAFVQLGAGAPRRWTIATRPGEDAASLGPTEIFSFPVDGGVAAVFDSAAATVLARAPDLYELTVPPLKGKLAVLIDLADAANALVVRSGDGDGFYAAWWGEDAAGALVALALDFKIFRQIDAPEELVQAVLAPLRAWTERAIALLDEVLIPLGFSPATAGLDDEPEDATSVVARSMREGVTVQISQSLQPSRRAIDASEAPCLSAGPPGDELCVELPEVADAPEAEGAKKGFTALAALLRRDGERIVKALVDEVAARA